MGGPVPLFLATFLVSVAYLPGIGGASTTPRWSVFLVGFSVLLLFAPRIRPTIGHLIWFSFVALSIASVLWSKTPFDTIGEIERLAAMSFAFLVAAETEDLTPAWSGLALGVTISAAIAVLQSGGMELASPAGSVPPAGLFFNKNFLAEAGVVALVASLSLRLWHYVPGTLVATVLPGSRAAIVALGAFLVFSVTRRIPRRFALPGGAVLLAAIVLLVWVDAITTNRIVTSINSRLEIWSWVGAGSSVWGWGSGSFPSMFPMFERAHSDFMETLHGTGMIGMGLLSLLFGWSLGGKDDGSAKGIALVLFVVALFGFPLQLPATAMAFALVAGRLCSAGSFDRCGAPSRGGLRGYRPEPGWPLGGTAVLRTEPLRRDLPA